MMQLDFRKKEKDELKGEGTNHQYEDKKKHVVNKYVLTLVETMKQAVRYQGLYTLNIFGGN